MARLPDEARRVGTGGRRSRGGGRSRWRWLSQVKVVGHGSDGRRRWNRRYLPLLALAAAIVLSIVALPSALNLPQANPNQTLEYAPLSPNDSTNPPPPGGNLAALGLGAGGGGTGPGAGPGAAASPAAPPMPPPGPASAGTGSVPSQKRCVGNPPRQTEDPFSPPCVAYFTGDNGGATYPGVSASEIRILIVYDGNHNWYLNSGEQSSPQNTYVDLWQRPPSQSEFFITHFWRVLQKYFSDRYQTYGRHPHFFLYYTHDIASAETPEEARGEAVDNVAQVHPFGAIVSMANMSETYETALAQRGVMNFSADLQTRSFYQGFADRMWGFLPAADYWSSLYTSFVCAQVGAGP